jgi:hypothetical protein
MLVNQLQRYVGHEVKVVEVVFNYKGHEFVECEASEHDTVLNEIRQQVEDAGYVTRVWFPGTVGTMELRGDRINVYVEKVQDHYEIVSIVVG